MDTRLPIPALLMTAKDAAINELTARLTEHGYEGVREGHGCVFGFIEPEGSRLTSLAEASGLTKQAVGEAVDDLQRLGYVERVPDPTDGRAKLVHLTEKGAAARTIGRDALAEVERRWAEQLGEERVAAMRETLEEIYALVIGRAPTPA
jgi:DNA-binding MarR family transcriptional regulator